LQSLVSLDGMRGGGVTPFQWSANRASRLVRSLLPHSNRKMERGRAAEGRVSIQNVYHSDQTKNEGGTQQLRCWRTARKQYCFLGAVSNGPGLSEEMEGVCRSI